MNNHRGEPLKITGEIPVSLNLLSTVNGFTILYMKVKGLFYVLIGLSWVFIQSPSREAGLAWIDGLTSPMVGVVWCVAGLVSITAAFIKSPKAKRLGFFVLIIVPILLGLYFFISWSLYFLPFAVSDGYQRGGVTTTSYWAYGASAYIMARIHASSSGGIEDTSKGVHP